MKKNTLVLRADADAYTGTGHFMRCLALGQTWSANGGHTVFVSRCTQKNLLTLLQTEGFEVHQIPSPHPDARDLATTISVLDRHPDSWIAIDGYSFDTRYQSAIHATGHKLLVIDDMGAVPEYHCDMILNQNPHAPGIKYHCHTATIKLLGCDYVLLRKEFVFASPKASYDGEALKVLLLMGGSDTFNLSPKVIEVLSTQSEPKLEIQVVSGAANPNEFDIEDAIKGSPHTVTLLKQSQDMPKLMRWADAAISGAGTSALELCYMGVPGLLLILLDNQKGVGTTLNEKGAAICLGTRDTVNWSSLPKDLTGLLKDQKRRQTLGHTAHKLIDGKGAQRVVDAILQFAQPMKKTA